MNEQEEKVAGIVLAAGASTRIGVPKQLLRVEGETLLDRMLDHALNSALEQVVLVLGFQVQKIKEGLKTDLRHPRLKIVENKLYEEGISSSIIAGLSAVEDAYGHIMILLADMPFVTTKLINHLLHQYLASRLDLGAISIKGRRSHPVIIGRRFYEELRQLKGDLGARDLFRKYSHQVYLVEPGEDYEDVDIDTLEDYVGLRERLQRPAPAEPQ